MYPFLLLPLPHPLTPTPLTQLDALTREMENGRLFRLVSKLAFVTDRPSSDVGAASGDTGNSYLLQLFRDFVFHQGERDAGRVIDWGHIVENLNKVGEMYWQSLNWMNWETSWIFLSSVGALL